MGSLQGFAAQSTTTITLFSKVILPDSGLVTLLPCVLRGVFWQSATQSTETATGAQVQTAISAYVLAAKESTGREYVSHEEWEKAGFTEKETQLWTFDPRYLPLVAKGEHPHRFTPATEAEIASQENTLLAKDKGVHRVFAGAAHLYGPRQMQHVELMAGTGKARLLPAGGQAIRGG